MPGKKGVEQRPQLVSTQVQRRAASRSQQVGGSLSCGRRSITGCYRGESEMIAKSSWAADAMHSLQSTCHSASFADDNVINVAILSTGDLSTYNAHPDCHLKVKWAGLGMQLPAYWSPSCPLCPQQDSLAELWLSSCPSALH